MCETPEGTEGKKMETCSYCHKDFKNLGLHLRMMSGRAGHPAIAPATGGTPAATPPVKEVEYVEVPLLEGLPFLDARRTALQAGLSCKDTPTEEAHHTRIPKEEVIKQRPGRGEMRPKGELVEMTVSLGPESEKAEKSKEPKMPKEAAEKMQQLIDGATFGISKLIRDRRKHES